MLNEWFDRDPDPPSPWRDRAVMGIASLIGIALLLEITQRAGLL